LTNTNTETKTMATTQKLESGTEMVRGSKKANGNLLDGQTNEADPFPKRLTAAEKHSTPALTPGERKEWQRALKTIEKGWQAFVEVGAALTGIRESRLYRAEYDSWEEFCRAVVGISKSEANRQIIDAEVVGQLQAPNGVIEQDAVTLPAMRSHVRALTKLKRPEDRRKVWQEIVEHHGDRITAQIVKEKVDALLGTPKKKPKQSASDVGGDDEVAFEFSNGFKVMVSEWVDGVITREMTKNMFAGIASDLEKTPERAAQIQWLVAIIAATANGEVSRGSDKDEVSDLHSALHKLQQAVATLC